MRALACALMLVTVLPSVARGACASLSETPQSITFASVHPVKALADQLAGIEIYLEFDKNKVTAELRDYEGIAAPRKTLLTGTFNRCEVSLRGRSGRGPVIVRATVEVARLQATITRRIGKDEYSETVSLRRRVPDSDGLTAWAR